ncbi:guanine nucleotide exchange factor for Rab-3A-like [Asterias rubens]|uniref:guanine nucleotide exchange factor for Rab-3A-like n=1 Tax=Asterias rubens TaxID=7604 RepID=UPI001455764D|nr:guanine nucleotide exchange factor for Rab-3A-like [Asterias rubens]XP_033629549.1 guanine nucleotide exchange factor for Rab-3A-like [Asterias rubens]
MATLAVKPTTLDLPQAFGHIRSSSDSNLLEKSHRFPNKDYEESPEEYYGDRPETEGFSIDPDKSESDQDTDSDVQDLAGEFRSRLNSKGHNSNSITEKLHEELIKAKEALELKDEQVSKLTRVREEMDQEITELTAKLFEEAHIMVNESNVKRAKAEKRLKEATGKIDVLQAEVQALKILVLTSTPSKPNPQSATSSKKRSILSKKPAKGSLSPNVFSHHRNHSLQGPISVEMTGNQSNGVPATSPTPESPKRGEADPVLLREFQAWKEQPTLSRDEPFISRIFSEDIFPCLNFPNQTISEKLQDCVEKFTLFIEPLPDKGSLPRRCTLTDQQRACHYRIKLGESEESVNICTAARNRIAAVCDFYTYLRYIKQGLVKSDLQEIYWEMIRLRREMALTKLGLQ